MAMLFKKAGVESWKAYVPVYNSYIWMEITGMKLYRVIFLFLPITNVFIALTMLVELNKSFGMPKLKEECLALFFPGYWLFYIGRKEDVKYTGAAGKKPKEKKNDWVEAIIFAVFAAVLIRWSTFEPYTIPTPSMEGSLLVGDYLFVSKMSYGPRAAITPLQIPLTHQTFPWANADDITNRKYLPTFLDWVGLPYYRFPGVGSIERNDVVVFNYPGDNSDYQIHPQTGERVRTGQNDRDYPIDLRTNYVKRCVAIPKDTIVVQHGDLLINRTAAFLHNHSQRRYLLMLSSTLNRKDKEFLSDLEVRGYSDNSFIPRYGENGLPSYEWNLSTTQLTSIREHFGIRFKGSLSVADINTNEHEDAKKNKYAAHINSNFFTRGGLPDWNVDNLGPVVVPYKGMVVKVNPADFELLFGCYQDVIENLDTDPSDSVMIDFENHQLIINDAPQTEYVFNQDYYWMMGDNRHNSADSRCWGFVPEDHIVGKALFVWMSVESGTPDSKNAGFFSNIRWNRIGTLIK
jgi:signal peptidase I